MSSLGAILPQGPGAVPVSSPFCTVKGMTRLKGLSMDSMGSAGTTGHRGAGGACRTHGVHGFCRHHRLLCGLWRGRGNSHLAGKGLGNSD